MGIGSARGDDRAVQAAELAISSPLLEASIDGAHGVLLSIQGGSDLGLFEINEAAKLVQEAAHPEANIIFGAVIDDALGDEVRVTVIAAGFDGGTPVRRNDDRALGTIQGSAPKAAAPQAPAQQQAPPRQAQPVQQQPVQQQPVQQQPQPVQHVPAHQEPSPNGESGQPAAAERPEPVGQTAGRPPRTVTFEDGDDLDVPDFLK
jgi:cell division protein FtsZ